MREMGYEGSRRAACFVCGIAGSAVMLRAQVCEVDGGVEGEEGGGCLVSMMRAWQKGF